MDRDILWKIMEKKGVDQKFIRRIKEIYSETENTVRINGEETETFWTGKGVRQGCPLSPTLFTIFISDLDEVLAQGQAGGVVIGKKKIWTLAYADDVAMLAKDEREMKEMMKNLEKYVTRKKLVLNVEKSKVMVFRKGRGKKEEEIWTWGTERIEEVKQFKYLGYTFQRNNGPDIHIKERCKKAVIAMRQAWGIGKRLFQDQFVRRIMLFDCLVKSILFYGVEVWGWREDARVEAIQERFLKWTLELDKCTPGYIVRQETGRDLLRVETGRRALGFEIKKRDTGNDLLKECYKEMDKEGTGGKWSKGRQEYFNRNGWSDQAVLQVENKRKVMGDIKNRDREVQRQEQFNRIQDSNYNPWYKFLMEGEMPQYLEKEGRKGSQKTRARLRCGNEELTNRYWEKEERKLCRICKKEKETFEHLVADCEEELNSELSREAILCSEEGERWIRKVNRRRIMKRKEEEDEERKEEQTL